MNEVIDLEKKHTPRMVQRAARLFVICVVLIVLAFVITFLSNPLRSQGADAVLIGIISIVTGLMFLAFMFLAPVGLFFCLRSYWKKEEAGSTRLLYTLGHGFFCMLIAVFLTILIRDLLKLF